MSCCPLLLRHSLVVICTFVSLHKQECNFIYVIMTCKYQLYAKDFSASTNYFALSRCNMYLSGYCQERVSTVLQKFHMCIYTTLPLTFCLIRPCLVIGRHVVSIFCVSWLVLVSHLHNRVAYVLCISLIRLLIFLVFLFYHHHNSICIAVMYTFTSSLVSDFFNNDCY